MTAIQGILVDSSVLLDIVTDDPHWFTWSSAMLATWADRASLYINVVIYAEVSIGFARIEEVETALPLDQFRRLPIPWEAGFLAGKAYGDFRVNHHINIQGDALGPRGQRLRRPGAPVRVVRHNI